MYLIYFDECKPTDDYPRYHIGGVAIHEVHLADIEQQVSDLALRTFGTHTLSKETEFHAAEIYHRKRAFRDWPDVGKRIEIIGRLAEILSSQEVQLINIQINCDRLYATQAPEDIAFMYLCERANSLMRANQSVGMLIGDRENDRVAERYATTLSSYRKDGTEFAYGTPIDHLVDSVHFTHSHLSRFLQLADVYAWLNQFRTRNLGSTEERHKGVLDILRRETVNLFPAKYKEWPFAR